MQKWVIKRWFKELNTYANMDYDKREDRIVRVIIETYAPGAGFDITIDGFKLDFSYKAGFSTGGSDMFQEAYTGNIAFSPYKNINTSISGTYSRTENPASNAANLTANFGMNF